MSQTPKDRPADAVSLRKNRPVDGGRPGAAGGSPADRPTVAIPRTIDLAVFAVFAEAFFTLLRALALRGYTSQLSQWLVDTNDKATGKNHKSPYGPTQVAHDLSQLRSGALVQSLVIAAALVILGFSMRRVRGASASRWVLIIVIVLTSGPLAVMPVDGWPALPKAAGVLMGAASIAAIVLVLLPPSMRYFRDCRAATRPAGAPARPGLAGLFAPRTPPQRPGGGTASTETARTGPGPQTAEAANPARAKAKAKVRVDAEAVAKGAELARVRSRAAKSRRAE